MAARCRQTLRDLEETCPNTPLLGTLPKNKTPVTMWQWRMKLEGFTAMMETVRSAVADLKDRTMAGTHDYA